MIEIVAGSANVSLYVYFVDDDGGTAPGEPTTGKLFSDIETGGSASYMRQGAARADFTLVTQTVAGAHADGGFVLVDDTNMPGLYRVDLPDAAFATGVDFVIIQMVMAAANNSIMRPLLVQLRDNPSVNVAQWLGSAAPALVGGRLDASVGAMASAVLTAAAIAADAITNAKIATDAIGADEFAQAAADKVFNSSGATLAELSVAAPPATPRPDQALMLLYMALRNKLDVTTSIKRVHNDAGTIVATKALIDDGSTYSEAEMISG